MQNDKVSLRNNYAMIERNPGKGVNVDYDEKGKRSKDLGTRR